MFAKIQNFFKEVWNESHKVDWPNRQATLRYTMIVIGISLAVAVFLGVLDALFMLGLGRFLF